MSNFSYEVLMKLPNAGYGGIFFGGNQNTGKSYYMQVGNDGTCAILVFQGTLNNLMLLSSIPLNFDRNIIYTPEDAQNLLAVSIHNHIISFFVNMKEIGILKDDLTNIQMYVGFGAGGRTQPSGATFQNAKVWQ